jgi:hypothetical protein
LKIGEVMSSIVSQGVVRKGKLELLDAIDLPEGTSVLVTIDSVNPPGMVADSATDGTLPSRWADQFQSLRFMSEEEQGNDRESIDAWINRLRTLPAVPRGCPLCADSV